jgi:hypothetical protein
LLEGAIAARGKTSEVYPEGVPPSVTGKGTGISTVREDSDVNDVVDVMDVSFVTPERMLVEPERDTELRFNEFDRDVERDCECTPVTGASNELAFVNIFELTSSFSSSSQTALIRRFSSTRGCAPIVFDRRALRTSRTGIGASA